MSYDNFFDEWEKQRKVMDRIANGTSFFDEWEQREKVIDRIANGTSFFDEWEQREKVMDRIANGTSFFDEWEQREKVIDRIANGTSFFDEWEQREKVIDRIANGTSFFDEWEQREKVMDRIANGTSFFDEWEQREKVIDRIANGTSIMDRFEQQQKVMDRIANGTSFAFNDSALSQATEVEQSLKGITKAFQDNRYNFAIVMASSIYIEDLTSLENTDITDDYYSELFEILVGWYTTLISHLQPIWNVITNDTAMKIMTVAGFIMTIVGLIIAIKGINPNDKEQTPKINIHNYSDNVEIETKTEGNQVEILIQDKDIERGSTDDKWLSGGDRT